MKIEDLADYIQYFNEREYSRMWPKIEQLLERYPTANFGHAWNETDNTILIYSRTAGNYFSVEFYPDGEHVFAVMANGGVVVKTGLWYLADDLPEEFCERIQNDN
jgi:hypothetical protein